MAEVNEALGPRLPECRRLNDCRRNPQEFIKLAAEAINRCKRHALVPGIKYQRLGSEAFYAQALFEQTELKGYLENMLQDTEKSVYAHVVYDSDTERAFADQLEKNTASKVYAKLPGWFRVPTPLGSYNPDWGRAGGHTGRRQAVLRGGDQEQPAGGRPAAHRGRQDQVRRGPL